MPRAVLAVPVAPPTAAAEAAEALHPALWRAGQLGRLAAPAAGALASGHAALDAQLPGGGWPARALTELLLPHPGLGELRLLAPVLAALQAQGRTVMWFDPPARPCAWTLSALGLRVGQLLLVRSRPPEWAGARHGAGRVAPARHPAADLLWALEQALKSGHLGAAVAWLPVRLPADALRRLQLAAQLHDGPVFLLRDAAEHPRPSPAPLRLLLAAAGPQRVQVRLLKRRGPPLAQPVVVDLPPVLQTAGPAAGPAAVPAPAPYHGQPDTLAGG